MLRKVYRKCVLNAKHEIPVFTGMKYTISTSIHTRKVLGFVTESLNKNVSKNTLLFKQPPTLPCERYLLLIPNKHPYQEKPTFHPCRR